MATVVQAWVNEKEQWRVYFKQELIATLEKEQWTQDFLNYLNDQGGNKKQQTNQL